MQHTHTSNMNNESACGNCTVMSVHALWPVAYATVTVFGIVGNTFVVIAVLGDRSMRASPMNLLLVHLVQLNCLLLCNFFPAGNQRHVQSAVFHL